MSVVNNTSRPESTLKKKSNAIAYHFVHESVASGRAVLRKFAETFASFEFDRSFCHVILPPNQFRAYPA